MIGKTILQYKILEELGRGGMGIVYKAEDAKLQRTVALKFLPPELTRDHEARERFIHEARAASALDHPNICTIHEINEADGHYFIAMSYIEGTSLKDKIRTGPLSIDEAIDIAGQIAGGLREAHEKGIIHRDIKPANIMITQKGQVKIMDFGLAKSPGRTQLTKEGTTLGTVAYMSPEQARGVDVDHRTDLWSLGVVLYEMLTGRQPFRGDYEQAVIYSIINDDIEQVGKLRPDVPTGLEQIVSKLLDKNKDKRYQNGTDLIRELDTLKESRVTSHVEPEAVKRRYTLLFFGLAVIVIVALFLIAKTFWQREGKVPPPVSRQVTYTGRVIDCALSPDGNYIAYVNKTEIGEDEIWVKDLSSGSTVKIFSNFMCMNVRWSPDGSQMLFNTLHSTTEGGIFLIPRFGGTTRQVLKLPWVYTTWSPDGSRIAYVDVGDHTIKLLDLETGATDTLSFEEISTQINYPEWSPSGRVILFQTDDENHRTFWTTRVDGTSLKPLLREEYTTSFSMMHPQWSPDGKAVYYLHGEMRGRLVFDLMKIPVDVETGEASGKPFSVLRSLHSSAGLGIGSFYSISNDGRRLLYVQGIKHSNLWLATVEGEEGHYTTSKKRLTTGTMWKSRASISPDGKHIAFAMGDENAMNIYTMSLEGERGEPEQLTFLNSLNDNPVWSPDGSEIAFYSNQGGKWRIWHVDVGGGTPHPLESSSAWPLSTEIAWAPGLAIIYRSTELENFTLLDPQSGRERNLLDDPPHGYMFSPHWSPDGTQIVFFWNRPEKDHQVMRTWIISTENGSLRKLTDEVTSPLGWSQDGQLIYILWADPSLKMPSKNVYTIPSTGGTPREYVEFPFEEGASPASWVSITLDGRKLVYTRVEEQADVWLVENFDPDVK